MEDEQTVRTYRTEEQAFTRRRKLLFPKLVALLLFGWKLPLKIRLNRLMAKLWHGEEMPTPSAVCQARRKIRPELFRRMNQEALAGLFVDCPETVRCWRGRLVWAVDATILNLPDTPETRARYSVQHNQHGGKEAVQGMASFLYDVLNEVTIHAVLDKKRSEKSFVLEEHRAHFREEVIVLYDRVYADYAVMASHAGRGADFVIRARASRTFREVEAFAVGEEVDAEVTLGVTPKQKRWVERLGLPPELRVRLVKVPLPNGTEEVLMTSLSREECSREDLAELYAWRWGVETYFDRLKNVFEVERFSTRTVVGIEQDFYGIVFMSTLAGILALDRDAELLEKRRGRKTKHPYKVNRKVCYMALVDRVVELLLDQGRSLEEMDTELRAALRGAFSPIRPGRSSPRAPGTPADKLRFLRYRKRIVP